MKYDEAYLLARINKIPETGCWEWTKGKTGHGYGCVGGGGGPSYAVHRLAFEFWKGPIKNGFEVCHTCDNPPCINPDHLWLGTRKENIQDAARKGRLSGHSNGDQRGERNGRAKLNEEQVKFIRCSTLSSRKLGALFFVASGTVQFVRRGFTWKHI